MNKKKIEEELEEIINLPELCYQPDGNKFWMKDSRGYFVYIKRELLLPVLSMNMR